MPGRASVRFRQRAVSVHDELGCHGGAKPRNLTMPSVVLRLKSSRRVDRRPDGEVLPCVSAMDDGGWGGPAAEEDIRRDGAVSAVEPLV